MNAISRQLAFGSFRLFPDERLLLKGDDPVRIGARALDLLIALVENPGAVVTSQELMERAWPNLSIEKGGLRVQMTNLRKVIGDGDDGLRYIVNVTGRGYSFIGTPTQVHSSAARGDADADSGALPRRLARIVGRTRDAEAVQELLATTRFVTIHGPGGIGKTTLALEVASSVAPSLELGARYVDLSLCQETTLVSDAVASALGLVARTSDSTSQILEYLRSRQLVLVLDCCEHLIEAAANFAEIVVRKAPRVAILATSREPLMADGEHVYSLPPLALPPDNMLLSPADLEEYPATRLFCERARAAGYRNEISPAGALIVAEICKTADGIALALELAASQVASRGLRQTAEHLKSHLKLNWRGRRTAPPRHQTLGAMLDWSYKHIDESEKDVLRRISVFVGWFSSDEAYFVAGVDGRSKAEFVELLTQLVHKSLVVIDSYAYGIRYRLIDATRSYALLKLADGSTEKHVRSRHAQLYIDRLTKPERDVGPEWTASSQQLGNISVALEWAFSPLGNAEMAVTLTAVSMEEFLQSGHLIEGQRWAEKALASLPAAWRGGHNEMLLRAAIAHTMLFTVEDLRTVEQAVVDALDLCERFPVSLRKFGLLSGLHMLARRKGAFGEMLPAARQAEAIAKELNSISATIAVKIMLGSSHLLEGELDRAIEVLSDARGPQEHWRNARRIFYGVHPDAEVLIARALWLKGLPDQAANMASAAGSLVRRDEPEVEIVSLRWAARVFYCRGDWQIVEKCADRMIELAAEHSFPTYNSFGQALRADVLTQRGDLDQGIPLLRDAIETLRADRGGIYTPWFTCRLAAALASRGYIDQGLALIAKLNPKPGNRSDAFTPELLRIHGDVLAAAGDAAEAQRLFRLSIEMADRQGALSWRLKTVTSAANLQARRGRVQEALDTLGETYARFTEGFETVDLRNAQALMTQLKGRLTSSR